MRFRAVNKDTFEAIKSGRKKVETRAATKRYADIKVGDIIIFICGKNSFQRKVKKVQIFETITAMLRKYKMKDINPFAKTEKEFRETYYSYSGYREKIKKHGLVAMELTK